MDDKHPRGLYALAYEKSELHPRRPRPSPVPGWTFDASVVLALLVAVVGFLTA